jgi:hypothetical protein
VTIWAAAPDVRFTGAAWIGLFIFGVLSWLISTQFLMGERGVSGQKQSLHAPHAGPRQAMHPGLSGFGMHWDAQLMIAVPHLKMSQLLCTLPFAIRDKPRPTGLAWLGEFMAIILILGW